MHYDYFFQPSPQAPAQKPSVSWKASLPRPGPCQDDSRPLPSSCAHRYFHMSPALTLPVPLIWSMSPDTKCDFGIFNAGQNHDASPNLFFSCRAFPSAPGDPLLAISAATTFKPAHVTAERTLNRCRPTWPLNLQTVDFFLPTEVALQCPAALSRPATHERPFTNLAASRKVAFRAVYPFPERPKPGDRFQCGERRKTTPLSQR